MIDGKTLAEHEWDDLLDMPPSISRWSYSTTTEADRTAVIELLVVYAPVELGERVTLRLEEGEFLSDDGKWLMMWMAGRCRSLAGDQPPIGNNIVALDHGDWASMVYKTWLR